jgi:hypothetical protein
LTDTYGTTATATPDTAEGITDTAVSADIDGLDHAATYLVHRWSLPAEKRVFLFDFFLAKKSGVDRSHLVKSGESGRFIPFCLP